jgi:hypothetical protein
VVAHEPTSKLLPEAVLREGMTDADRTVEPGPAVGARVPGERQRRLAPARRTLARGRALLVRLFDQRGRVDRGLTVGMFLLVGVICVLGIPELRPYFPAGIDFEIPLRAASRWAGGGQAYPPSAMQVQGGPDLPYLYPPFLLPLLAPIAALPRDVVTGLWLLLCYLCAIWTCRRLTIPWLAIAFLLAWPPFAEGLLTGNVQILGFAAFVALLYERADGGLRQRAFLPARDTLNGVLAGAVGVLKVAQLLSVLYLARRRMRAAVIGLATLAALVIVMLPLTGIAIYGDYLAQLQRATNPAWTIGGVAIGRRLGLPDVVPMAIGVAMALSVRGRDSAAWLGIALLIATPSAHGYTFLFLLPGLLTIRRDIAIPLAALFIGVYHATDWWIASGLVVVLLIAMTRWTWLRVVESAKPGERAPGLGERAPGLGERAPSLAAEATA